MIPTWRERLRRWLCERFGHRPHGDPTPLGGGRWCRRCGLYVPPGGAQ